MFQSPIIALSVMRAELIEFVQGCPTLFASLFTWGGRKPYASYTVLIMLFYLTIAATFQKPFKR